jgi:hypothetical protein
MKLPHRLALSLATISLLVPQPARSQSQTPPPAPPLSARVPPANPADVNSIDAIMRAIYDVISGPAGPRDWNRLRSLCVPEARLTSTVKGPGSESEPVRLLTVDDYVQRAGKFFSTHPFYESAIVNRVQRFGNIAQVFSSYASSSGPTEKPFARGINSFQLFNDGTRWWVLSILWDEESPTNPLPTEMSSKPSSPVSQ